MACVKGMLAGKDDGVHSVAGYDAAVTFCFARRLARLRASSDSDDLRTPATAVLAAAVDTHGDLVDPEDAGDTIISSMIIRIQATKNFWRLGKAIGDRQGPDQTKDTQTKGQKNLAGPS